VPHRLALLCLALLALACHSTAAVVRRDDRAPARPAPPPSLETSEPAEELPTLARPTSPAYAGDLSLFEHPERDRRLQIERVMDVLGIQSGSAVADLGAGGGWFAVRAARRVGATGSVRAVEINPKYVEHIRVRAEREGLSNVHASLGTEADPGLDPASVDVVVLLKTYHELSAPLAVLRELRRAMRAGGRLGVLDRNGHGDDHGLDEAVVTKEITSMGFTLRERHDWPSPEERIDYFLVFVR
jgi:SAM-dependent methyltransferase